jgi:hypothetical protein
MDSSRRPLNTWPKKINTETTESAEDTEKILEMQIKDRAFPKNLSSTGSAAPLVHLSASVLKLFRIAADWKHPAVRAKLNAVQS